MVSFLDLSQRENASVVNNVIGEEYCDEKIDI